MNKTEPHIIIIFGASGDLTRRKLIPALFLLYSKKLLPNNFFILGTGRTNYTLDEFKERLKPFLKNEKEKTPEVLEKFCKYVGYKSIDTDNVDSYVELKHELDIIRKEKAIPENYIYYLSTPPTMYEKVAQGLSKARLNVENGDKNWKRMIIEKPFGVDYQTAKYLNKKLLSYFSEHQLYRIDHYLGKETVQNILVTRFANGIFEPLWNRNFIHHVEITAAESLGVEGRGGYYDNSGALRDMVQNHLLQLVGLIAMEPPTIIQSSSIRNETMKVLQSLRPIDQNDVEKYVIRGQYTPSKIKGECIKGYRKEPGVNPNSRTETYVGMKFFIDNWRWSDVPFYIRTGKRLPTRVTEAVIHFKKSPHHLFVNQKNTINTHNQMVMRIQPDEGLLVKFSMKVPGHGFEAQIANMDFHYSDFQTDDLPSGYERLLLDCMQGDSTLYIRGDAVEQAWQFVQPILDAWKNKPEIPVYGYPAGSWGPENADLLIEEPEFTWRYPCKNLSDDGEYCEL